MKLVADAETLLLLVAALEEFGTPTLGNPVGDRLGSDAAPETLPLP